MKLSYTSLDYTKKQYFKDFNRKFIDDIELIDNKPIASGSIGQVYKGILKK